MDNELLDRALAATPDDDTVVRILEAARKTFSTFGVRRSTMEDVARAAGIGRATVYRRFGSKDELVEAVLLDDLRHYTQRLDRLTAGLDITEQLVEGFAVTLKFVREEALFGRVLELGGDEGLAYITILAGPVISAAGEYIAAKLSAAQERGQLADIDPVLVGEILVRVIHSLMLTPQGAIPTSGDQAVRDFARQHLVPIVTRSTNGRS